MRLISVSDIASVRSEPLRITVAAALVIVASVACAQSNGPWPYCKTILHSFAGAPSDGAGPSSRLIVDRNGALYGTTPTGGSMNQGAVFMLTPPAPGQTQWTETVLYSFQGGRDGNAPANLIFDAQGALYGTTAGESGSAGTVFKLTPPGTGQTQWTETVVYRAYYPSGLAFDAHGALYVTTSNGGPWGQGAVFKLTPPASGQTQWIETELYDFQGGRDGIDPQGGLIFDAQGALYGTTAAGGTWGNGAVFKLTPPGAGLTHWAKTDLYSPGPGTGNNLSGGVILDTQGAVYGAIFGFTGDAFETGDYFGMVFKLTPPVPPARQWTSTTIYRFHGNDGWNPVGGLIVDTQGALYGTTHRGGQFACGNSGCGVAFKLAPPASGQTRWTETVLYSFQRPIDGAYPWGGLTSGAQGALYGTTISGGSPPHYDGTVFKLSTPVEEVLGGKLRRSCPRE
jgi:hypothetical protein